MELRTVQALERIGSSLNLVVNLVVGLAMIVGFVVNLAMIVGLLAYLAGR